MGKIADNKKRFCFALRTDIVEAARKEAEARGLSLASLVALLITRFLKDKKLDA